MRFLLLALLMSCSAHEPAASPAASPAAPEPAPAADAVAAAAPAAPAEGAVPGAAAGPVWKNFGEAFTVASAQPVKGLLDAPAGSVGKVVRVEGTVLDVCQKKGCWLVLSDGSRQIRVLTKEHAFGVDLDSTGVWADVEGTVTEKPHDEEESKHILSESARPELAPEKAGQPTYQLIATAIRTHR